MKTKKGGYLVPVAIGILVVASLGLLLTSWWGSHKSDNTSQNTAQNTTPTNTLPPVEKNTVAPVVASDDKSLDADDATIDAQLKALDNSSTDINAGLNDTSTI